MAPTDPNSQEHDEGDSINNTQSLNSAGDENADHQPTADEVTNQTDVSPPQVIENGTETTQETNRNDDGCETENDVGNNREEKHLDQKAHKGSSSNVKDKKGPDVLEEIQMQGTHDLYCPNCTHNITGTAKLFKKGEETFPYNEEKFILWFVVVISFKYPFIYLPWLYNNTQEPVKPIQPKSRPPLQAPSGQEQDNNLVTLLVKIREKLLPNRFPRLSPTSQRFLLVLVLLLLSVILLLTLPSRPSPPRPIKHGNSTEIDVQTRQGENVTESEVKGDTGGGFSFSWLRDFLSHNYLSVILLLFLAILAVLWRSMIENDPKETGAVTVPQERDNVTDQAKVLASVTNSPGTEVIAIEKPTKNANQSEDPTLNIEDHTSQASASSIKLIPIKLDIIKSIVYGGLIESITSFGVVSSAAASGTSTLNVLALALANLFSGLFIIIHNLYGLFRGPRYPSWNNDHMPELVAVDPYQELLGKRNRVILHCFVVLISFIFFGVIPPLSYGISFKITDKGHYEEAAVVIAASLICVISLSFAKAYAFGMDKLKTVAAYTVIAVVGSTLSFIASQHARDVVAKYDFHKLASDYLKG